MKKIAVMVILALFLAGSALAIPPEGEKPVVEKWYNCPNEFTQVIDAKGYFFLTGAIGEDTAEDIRACFEFLHKEKIMGAVIEIHSPGGSVWDSLRIVGLVRYWQGRGVKVETRVHGVAISGAFYIFAVGDKRVVDPHAMLMWHELSGDSMARFTPTSTEDLAKVMRLIQVNLNDYIASRCTLTRDEIDKRIGRVAWWMTGVEAVKYGLADEMI